MRRHLQLFVFALISTLLLGAGVVAADSGLSGPDHEGCEEIEATIRSTADFDNFTTAGVIEGDLDGTTMLTGDVSSIAVVDGGTLSPLRPTLSYTAELEITTEDGVLTTRTVGVFEQGPNGVGTQFENIVSGTGEFSDASGYLFLNFTADETGANFTSAVTGVICGVDDSDPDDDDDDDSDHDDDDD